MATFEELQRRAARKGWTLNAHYDNQSKHNFYTLSLNGSMVSSFKNLEEVEYRISRLAYQPTKEELAPYKKARKDPAKAEAKKILKNKITSRKEALKIIHEHQGKMTEGKASLNDAKYQEALRYIWEKE